jgi:hypothetical protein
MTPREATVLSPGDDRGNIPMESKRTSIYRAQAVAHRAAGAERRAKRVLRVSPRWTRAVYGLVALGALGALAGFMALLAEAR